jgi:hypothetical protein
MSKDDLQVPSESSLKASHRGHVSVVLFVLVLALLAGIGFVVTRGEDAVSSAPSTAVQQVLQRLPPEPPYLRQRLPLD